MAEYAKPLPIVNDLNRPHWEGARSGRFMVQRCRGCGHLALPPMPHCSNCLETDIEWVAASGRGTVFSWIEYHQGWLPGYRDETPYNVAIIELEEGLRVVSNLVGIAHERIAIGMPVEVCFEEVTSEVTIPRFRPRT